MSSRAAGARRRLAVGKAAFLGLLAAPARTWIVTSDVAPGIPDPLVRAHKKFPRAIALDAAFPHEESRGAEQRFTDESIDRAVDDQGQRRIDVASSNMPVTILARLSVTASPGRASTSSKERRSRRSSGWQASRSRAPPRMGSLRNNNRLSSSDKPRHPRRAAGRRAISARLPRFALCTPGQRSSAAPLRRHEGNLRSDRDQACSRHRQGSLRILAFSRCAPPRVANLMLTGALRKKRSSIAANGAMVMARERGGESDFIVRRSAALVMQLQGCADGIDCT